MNDLREVKHNGHDVAALPPFGRDNPRPEFPHALIDAGLLTQSFWEHGPALAWIKSEDGRYVHFSNAFVRHFGAGAAQWLGRTDAEVQPPEIARISAERDRAVIERGVPAEALESHAGADGVLRHYLMQRFPLVTREGKRYVACLGVDISAHRMHPGEAARLAVTDDATGVCNQRGFLLLADHELKIARRRKTYCTLLRVDIDGLAQVNGEFGHRDGDVLLVETALLLRDVFRESDVVGRIGSDDFAVFALDAGAEPEQLKARLHAQLEHFPRIADQPRPLCLSVGVASCRPEDRVTLDDLLCAAALDLAREKTRKQQPPPRPDYAAMVRAAQRADPASAE